MRYGSLLEGADNATANVRHFMHTASFLPFNVFYWQQFCAVHGIHRVMMHMIEDTTFTGSVFAVQFVSSIPQHHEKLTRKTREWLDECLDL